MSILKMKKLRLIGLRSEKDAILKELLLRSCVEISEPPHAEDAAELFSLVEKESVGLDTLKLRFSSINQAIGLLDRYAPEKHGLFEPKPELMLEEFLDESRLEGSVKLSEDIAALEADIKRSKAEVLRLNSLKESLFPWQSLDLSLDKSGTSSTELHLCSFPASADMGEIRTALMSAAPEAELIAVYDDASLHYNLLVAHKAAAAQAAECLRAYGYAVMNPYQGAGTPAEISAKADSEIKALSAEIENCVNKIAGLADRRFQLQLNSDLLQTKIFEAENRARLLNTRSSFFFEGWLPAQNEKELSELLSRYSCAFETADPGPEEYPAVPVKLKNNFFTNCMNMVTEMYALPAYDGLDPNPLMAPFFIVFYGLMMADMAYGIIMMLFGVLMLKKKKATGTLKYMAEIAVWTGIATFIWGALTGGFMGDFIPQLCRMINPASTFELPYLFTPLADTMMILIGSLALGVIQIFTGMAVSVYKKIKDGRFLDAVWDEFAWWFMLFGVAIMLTASNTAGKALLIAGFVLLAAGCVINNKGAAKITALGGALYNGVTGYFSDILSYARLMALMLAGSVIAQVFNTLGSVLGNVIFFVIISLIGNALNFALNILGCYVHDLRLQVLEYFNRFYKEGGKAFSPLSVKTKFVNTK